MCSGREEAINPPRKKLLAPLGGGRGIHKLLPTEPWGESMNTFLTSPEFIIPVNTCQRGRRTIRNPSRGGGGGEEGEGW